VLYRRYKQRKLATLRCRQQWLFMSQGYREECCWWECVVILRKFCLSWAGAGMGSAAQGHQAFVALLVLVICLAAQLAAKPYVSHNQGRLETASLLASGGSLYLGLLWVLGGVSAAGQVAAAVAVVALNVAFVCVMVWDISLRVRGVVKVRQESRRQRAASARSIAAGGGSNDGGGGADNGGGGDDKAAGDGGDSPMSLASNPMFSKGKRGSAPRLGSLATSVPRPSPAPAVVEMAAVGVRGSRGGRGGRGGRGRRHVARASFSPTKRVVRKVVAEAEEGDPQKSCRSDETDDAKHEPHAAPAPGERV